MSKTVSSFERQAELSICQNALKTPLLSVQVGRRSEEEKKTPCHWVAGASLELLCTSFSLLATSWGLTNMLLFGGLQTQHIQQQTSNRQIPPLLPGEDTKRSTLDWQSGGSRDMLSR